MLKDGKIWIANTEDGENIFLLPKMANRHGLIAGATGTGKTITLKVLAESFSDMGVPVLSMHSPFEIISKLDLYELTKGINVFFRN